MQISPPNIINFPVSDRVKDKERSIMYEMEYRNYEYSREKALREEIMAGRDKFFMQSSLKGSRIEEHEKLLSNLFRFNHR